MGQHFRVLPVKDLLQPFGYDSRISTSCLYIIHWSAVLTESNRNCGDLQAYHNIIILVDLRHVRQLPRKAIFSTEPVRCNLTPSLYEKKKEHIT